MAKNLKVGIVGGGPMGIAVAIACLENDFVPIVFERGSLVNSIYHFPQNMTFFSTSQRLEIGNVPFISDREKPTRNEALEYYRRLVEQFSINYHSYEEVLQVKGNDGNFIIQTKVDEYTVDKVVIATGFYDKPNLLNVPGEGLSKVKHYYDEPHPYVHQKSVVIGAGNSACQTALELFHKNSKVSMIIRGSEIKPSVKYWIKPNIENRIKEGSIQAFFNSEVTDILPHSIRFKQNGEIKEIENDFVLAMTGYHPDYEFLGKIGIVNHTDEFNTPYHNPKTQETNRKGIYIAGVMCGGYKTNRYIIENSKVHADLIINDIKHA